MQGLAAYPGPRSAMLADPELHGAIGQMMAGEGAAPVDPMEMILAQYDDGVVSGELPPLLEMGAGVKALSMSVDVPGGDMFVHGGDQRRQLGGLCRREHGDPHRRGLRRR